MSDYVAAAQNRDNQSNVDERIFQTLLSATIELVRKWGEAHRFC